MDRVHYAGGSILTGSTIAEVLVDYAEALAQAGSAGTAVVPTVETDGSRGQSHILVGPSSQMMTVHEECVEADPVDEDWVREYRDKIYDLRHHGPPAPTAVPEPALAAEGWIAEI